jgi:hypothetical protein
MLDDVKRERDRYREALEQIATATTLDAIHGLEERLSAERVAQHGDAYARTIDSYAYTVGTVKALAQIALPRTDCAVCGTRRAIEFAGDCWQCAANARAAREAAA